VGVKIVLKKTLAIIVIILLVVVVLFSFTLYKENSPISLDSVCLKLSDITEEGFKEYDAFYITEPYIAPSVTLFAGWEIQEKYHVRFSKNDSCFILIDLGKLKSTNDSEEFISTIRESNFLFDFIEVPFDTIGDNSYVGKNITDDFGPLVPVYFIVFKIDKIVAAVMCTGISKESGINYAKIIESNIINFQ